MTTTHIIRRSRLLVVLSRPRPASTAAPLLRRSPAHHHHHDHPRRLLSTSHRPPPPPSRQEATNDKQKGPSSAFLFVKSGLPLVLFSLGAAWVLKNGLEGKTKEYEAYKGTVSKSERQARMEKEQNDMMEKLNKIKSQDFDNTKRIERPDEILARRQKEREQRNVWYRRWGRWLMGKE